MVDVVIDGRGVRVIWVERRQSLLYDGYAESLLKSAKENSAYCCSSKNIQRDLLIPGNCRTIADKPESVIHQVDWVLVTKQFQNRHMHLIQVIPFG